MNFKILKLEGLLSGALVEGNKAGRTSWMEVVTQSTTDK